MSAGDRPGVDPLAVMRTRQYRIALVVAVGLGLPIAVLAYWFLKLTELVQVWTFTDLPQAVGFDSAPTWWPVLPLAFCGLFVGLTVRYLPGHGGAAPSTEGFKAEGVAPPVTLPGIALAALASIGLGAVVGPEMPLIALGGGLAYLTVRQVKHDLSPQAGALVAVTGSFAAISTLLGTPLTGAFLLLEASSVGGTMATVVLLPGLLGAGMGALIFTGLNSVTGYGTFSLALPSLPPVGAPTLAEFAWAVAIGLAAAPVCLGLQWLTRHLRDRLHRRLVSATTLLGLLIAGLAISYAYATGHSSADVLFSGQAELPRLITHSADYTVGALVALMACKGLAYAAALSGFRGGPVFPAIFIGAVGGITLSHLPGLPMIPAVAMGIAAMSAGMLRLPMTAVLLATLLLGTDGVTVMPLTIVSGVVAYVTVNWMTTPTPDRPAADAAAPSQATSADEAPAAAR